MPMETKTHGLGSEGLSGARKAHRASGCAAHKAHLLVEQHRCIFDDPADKPMSCAQPRCSHPHRQTRTRYPSLHRLWVFHRKPSLLCKVYTLRSVQTV